MDAQLIAQFRDNTSRASSRLHQHGHHHHGQHQTKRSRSASPWNHTYMEIDRRGGIRKPLTEEEENGMVDPVYEEIERSAGCGGGDLCPCNHQMMPQQRPAHYQQASDLSDEDRRQNSSDVSRQSSRSYGDNRPLIPHQHQHQLSTQSQPGNSSTPHDLLTTISCAFNSPHLRTKHRHPFDGQQTAPIHMGFDGAPHFVDSERYSQRPAYPSAPSYDHHPEGGLTALNLMNGERIFVASGAVLDQRPVQQSIIQRPIPFTEC